jgi:hypothetical protein
LISKEHHPLDSKIKHKNPLVNSVQISSMATIRSNSEIKETETKIKSKSKPHLKHPRTAFLRKRHNYFSNKKPSKNETGITLSPYGSSQGPMPYKDIVNVHRTHYNNMSLKVEYSLSQSNFFSSRIQEEKL